MKWAKKKQPSSSSSRPFLISQVIPTSWLTKFKHMSINSGQKHANVKQKGKWTSVCSTTTNSSQFASGGGKFYGGDSDAFWRLSFGEDSLDGINSRSNLRSVRYSIDDDLEFPPSSCHSYRSIATRVNGKEGVQKFSNMVSHVRKIRGLPEEVEILPEVQTSIREKVAEIRTPRLKVDRDKILRKGNQRSHATEGIPRKVVVKNMHEMESVDCKLAADDPRKDDYYAPMNSRNSYPRKFERCDVFAAENGSEGFSTKNFSFEWQKLKEKKIEELKSRNEEQRKSLYISRELEDKKPKNSNKVRVYSPRKVSKAEICKIKALEDMKRSKLKMKKMAKEKTMEEFKGLESFAVVKCSYDPQQDFRDSMIEMITEQRISQPEELEELLACYLTLNSDEYHDLIIRVFRQVWLDMNRACLDTELENEERYLD